MKKNNDRIKILYTIPNFDTAGSGIALMKMIENLDKNRFVPKIACLHGHGDLFKEVIKMNIEVYFIDLYKNPRPLLRMFKECYNLARVFKKINPHIIHSYNYSSDYTEPLAARIAGIKWVYTKKNMSWEGPSYRSWKIRSTLANGIICQNKDMLKDFFYESKKARLISIGVNVKKYSPHKINNTIYKIKNLKAENRFIITVANLIPVKGIEVLINAFYNLKNLNNEWSLIIVGDKETDYGKKLEKLLILNDRNKEKVIFTGRKKNVRDFLDISEIYVQPTLDIGRREGAPISIQEAMANGKVVIGSDIPGIRDQLEDFPNNLFVPGDVRSLMNRLSKFMINDVDKNKKIGASFIQHVKNKYSLSMEKNKIEKYYNYIIKK